jgi:hypothetical protein
MIAASLTVVTNLYFALDNELESLLSNLAGLLVLNEFDVFFGYLFEIKVHKHLPTLLSSESYMISKNTNSSTNVAQIYVQLFVFMNFVNYL